MLVPTTLAEYPWRLLLTSEPFIRYDRNSFDGRLTDRFLRRIRVTVHDVVELDEVQSIVGLVAKGIGVAIAPQTTGIYIPKNVATISLGCDTFTREVGLVERNIRAPQIGPADFSSYICDAVKLLHHKGQWPLNLGDSGF
jgi:DNA-binding transcriptional LysR family regulator